MVTNQRKSLVVMQPTLRERQEAEQVVLALSHRQCVGAARRLHTKSAGMQPVQSSSLVPVHHLTSFIHAKALRYLGFLLFNMYS